jgi:hypothetical protein
LLAKQPNLSSNHAHHKALVNEENPDEPTGFTAAGVVGLGAIVAAALTLGAPAPIPSGGSTSAGATDELVKLAKAQRKGVELKALESEAKFTRPAANVAAPKPAAAPAAPSLFAAKKAETAAPAPKAKAAAKDSSAAADGGNSNLPVIAGFTAILVAAVALLGEGGSEQAGGATTGAGPSPATGDVAAAAPPAAAPGDEGAVVAGVGEGDKKE